MSNVKDHPALHWVRTSANDRQLIDLARAYVLAFERVMEICGLVQDWAARTGNDDDLYGSPWGAEFEAICEHTDGVKARMAAIPADGAPGLGAKLVVADHEDGGSVTIDEQRKTIIRHIDDDGLAVSVMRDSHRLFAPTL